MPSLNSTRVSRFLFFFFFFFFLGFSPFEDSLLPKQKIIAAVTKEVNAIARDIIRNEITLVDPLFRSLEKQWTAATDEPVDGNVSD